MSDFGKRELIGLGIVAIGVIAGIMAVVTTPAATQADVWKAIAAGAAVLSGAFGITSKIGGAK